MTERPAHLAHLEHLGDATKFSPQIHALIPKCNLLENFSPAEVRLLAHFMDVYQAPAGTTIIREGEGGEREVGTEAAHQCSLTASPPGRPNKPCGRTNSTTNSTANAATSL